MRRMNARIETYARFVTRTRLPLRRDECRMSIALPAARARARLSATPGQIALALGIAAFLRCSWSGRSATVIYVAFTEKGTGAFTLVNFVDFVRTDLFVRSFWNSFYVSAMAVVGASVLRAAAGLHHHALHVSRHGADPDAGLPAADHAAVRRRGGDAAVLRPQRHASICCSTTGSASRSRSWKA